MSPTVADRKSAPGSARIWGRRAALGLAMFWTALTALVVACVLLPQIPGVSPIATLLESFFSLHIAIAGVVGFIFAVCALQFGAGRVAAAAAAIALLATLGALIPLLFVIHAANLYGAKLSWLDQLRGVRKRAANVPIRTIRYAHADGKDLYVDIYAPTYPSPEKSPPVLMMHGGGYVSGKRSMFPDWSRWLSARGYTVFDIDYRLAPPPTWNQAAQDAACALAWINAHADEYHVAPDRLLIAGQSAGAGLALQVAYGLGDGTVQSSCGGVAPQPKAVFAIYPPDDFALGWNMNTKLVSLSARSLLQKYIGGSPEQYPDRYRAVSAIFHVRPGLPPTLIAAGEHDHLVPFEGHLELVEKLNQAGVPNVLIAIPYGEHAYDLYWGGFGAQITRHGAEKFLNQYLFVAEPHDAPR
jgi:acetyl esterase/lipase